MNRLLSPERGMTLIEVLVTLVIMTIISSIIYSVFITGIKLYQKIGIEGQLRDDADYIATMILNELYENTPNYIEDYKDTTTGATGIRLVRYEAKTVNRYIIEESTATATDIYIYYLNNQFYVREMNPDGSEKETREISVGTSNTTSTTVDGTPETTDLSIGQCSSNDSNGHCTHGTIALSIVIEDDKSNNSSLLETKPLILKSTF
jgi:prepilin-type N-terminal cleavage/methylation domain-containing protein